LRTDIKVFILAGGFGTRLRSVTKDIIPKPMVDIGNGVFLDFLISNIRKQLDIQDIYLLTHHFSDIIESHYAGDEKIHIIKENQPMGTGGAIKYAIKHIGLKKDSKILVFNGDTFCDVDLSLFTKNTSASVCIVSVAVNDCDRYGTLEVDDETIINFFEKQVNSRNAWINAGIYLFNGLDFFYNIYDEVFAVETEIKTQLGAGLKVNAYKHNGFFIDIGVPEDYYRFKQAIGGLEIL